MENEHLLRHPLYDHQPHEVPPLILPTDKTPPCPDALCLKDIGTKEICQKCPRQLENTVAVARPGWGGRRRGAGAPKFNFNRLKDGRQSVLIRRAVDILMEHHELRPFLLLIARAAVEGEIPQTTRRVIIKALGKKIGGMQTAAAALRRLRDAT